MTQSILHIPSSARSEGSISRTIADELISHLSQGNNTNVTIRDAAAGIPFVDAKWVEANFTPAEDRTDAHKDTLAFSDTLVAEIAAADTLVIGMPIYNFGVPATLKAWVDMIARARLTFRYTENGPEGLMTGKKAYIVVASGGVPLGSPMDFATPYIRQALNFIGITDISFIDASTGKPEALAGARDQITQIAA